MTWAQRADIVFVTIDLTDMTEKKLDIAQDKLVFHGTGVKGTYALELPLFDSVIAEVMFSLTCTSSSCHHIISYMHHFFLLPDMRDLSIDIYAAPK